MLKSGHAYWHLPQAANDNNPEISNNHMVGEIDGANICYNLHL